MYYVDQTSDPDTKDIAVCRSNIRPRYQRHYSIKIKHQTPIPKTLKHKDQTSDPNTKDITAYRSNIRPRYQKTVRHRLNLDFFTLRKKKTCYLVTYDERK